MRYSYVSSVFSNLIFLSFLIVVKFLMMMMGSFELSWDLFLFVLLLFTRYNMLFSIFFFELSFRMSVWVCLMLIWIRLGLELVGLVFGVVDSLVFFRLCRFFLLFMFVLFLELGLLDCFDLFEEGFMVGFFL